MQTVEIVTCDGKITPITISPYSLTIASIEACPHFYEMLKGLIIRRLHQLVDIHVIQKNRLYDERVSLGSLFSWSSDPLTSNPSGTWASVANCIGFTSKSKDFFEWRAINEKLVARFSAEAPTTTQA